ncbi:endonuclease [Spiractinospora alimapuensis]|uniref:endonuclease n=1 Tax=Spiractinospora alimapuensis TaxID=2820884 RepID=UPI001F3AC1C7|nr:endonuclease [Spiractinospora alimapuensis]QVQ50194.1 endonuclease [Spiractinospora alimapuensis]
MSSVEKAHRIAHTVQSEVGTTIVEQAGIRLADTPAPLWQSLVAANLLSTRISASIAVDAARELNKAGGNTAEGMAELTWQERVDALGRGHYVRYDESTATRLGECAQRALDRYRGDLRRMDAAKNKDRRALVTELQEFKGIGPTGADIFCREVQQVWDWLRPYADKATLKGAQALGLPQTGDELGALVPGDDLAAFFAGLVHIGRDRDAAERVKAAS